MDPVKTRALLEGVCEDVRQRRAALAAGVGAAALLVGVGAITACTEGPDEPKDAYGMPPIDMDADVGPSADAYGTPDMSDTSGGDVVEDEVAAAVDAYAVPDADQ